ncbi:MAG: hypothetical protein ACREDY_17180 [Bradyrhizobium sp.]
MAVVAIDSISGDRSLAKKASAAQHDDANAGLRQRPDSTDF